jgi:hypothetical protein
MEDTAKFITAISALIGVLAWPVVIGVGLFYFRNELKGIAAKIPSLIERIKTLKLAGIETQLSDLADKIEMGKGDKGQVTADQVHLSASLKVQANEIGKDRLLAEMDRLAIEYDTIRRAMPAGAPRTRQMTRIVVQMRALSQSVSDMIDAYKSSGSAGSRLAAVVMMQMEPEKADVEWLKARFSSEKPFVFYHSALALQNVVNASSGDERRIAVDAAKEALATVNSSDLAPDKNTVQVLRALVG